MQWDLQNESSCHDFFKKVQQDLADKSSHSESYFSSYDFMNSETSFVRKISRVLQSDGKLLPNLNLKNLSKKKDLRYLIVLNGVERLLQHDGDFFIKDFLEPILDKCPTVTVMISSCEWIDYIPNVPSTIIKVNELDRLSAVEFFLKETKHDLKAREIFDLVTKYPVFEFNEVLPNLSPEKQQELLTFDSLKDYP